MKKYTLLFSIFAAAAMAVAAPAAPAAKAPVGVFPIVLDAQCDKAVWLDNGKDGAL